jgi:hypothetical protein
LAHNFLSRIFLNSYDDCAGFCFVGKFYKRVAGLFIRPIEQNFHTKQKTSEDARQFMKHPGYSSWMRRSPQRFTPVAEMVPDRLYGGLEFPLRTGVRSIVGNITRVQIKVKVSPTVSIIPILAVPWCDESIRLAKSTKAVRAL